MKVKFTNKEVSKSGESNGRVWKQYKYTTDDGQSFYLFDDLSVGQEYELEQYKNKKGYDTWGLIKPDPQRDQLARLEKKVDWLIKNHPAYQPPQQKPEGPAPF